MRFLISLTAILVLSITLTFAQTSAPRIISECIVQYEITMDSKADPQLIKSMEGAIKTVYIKGNKSRSDLVSPSYAQTILNDSKSDTTIILSERGNSKFISYINSKKRNEQYKRFEGITFTPTNETKPILGYDCIRVVANLKDGRSFNVFYTPSIIPSNKEFDYQFRDLPGFVLEYDSESSNGKSKNKYSAVKITLSVVPASKFEAPTSGYRIL